MRGPLGVAADLQCLTSVIQPGDGGGYVAHTVCASPFESALAGELDVSAAAGSTLALGPKVAPAVVEALLALWPVPECQLPGPAWEEGGLRSSSSTQGVWWASLTGLSQVLRGLVWANGPAEASAFEAVDPAAALAALAAADAQRHEAPATPLGPFLRLLQGSRRAFAEAVAGEPWSPAARAEALACVTRFFDGLELASVGEWERQSAARELEAMQAENLGLTAEKREGLALFESVQEPVFVLDAQGHVRRWNPAAAQQVGGTPAPGGAATSGDPARPAWLQSVEAQLEGLPVVGPGALVLATRRGGRTYEASSRELRDAAGAVTGRVVVLRDVTDRRRAEDLEAAARELARQRDEQTMAAERLRTFHEELVATERMASVGQLAAGVAHEVNNPLAWTRANLASLEAFWKEAWPLATRALATAPELREAVEHLPLAAGEVEELLSDALEGCDRIKRIVDRLSATARAGEEETPRPLDLRRVVEDAVSMTQRRVEAHATLKVDLAEVPRVVGRPGALGLVVQNLLLNAARAFDEPGVVRVRLWALGGGVGVEVADTGRGIAPEALAHVFEPFFTTRRTGEGAGLGLFVAWGIARAHGGQLTVESRPGEGSAFRLWLPLGAQGPGTPATLQNK